MKDLTREPLYEELLVENRLDFLKQKYREPLIKIINAHQNYKPGERLPEFYDPIIDEMIADLAKLDPSPNKAYLQWILHQYVNAVSPTRFYEDINRIRNALAQFHVRKQLLPVEQRDINRFKTYQDLETAVDSLDGSKTKNELKREEVELLKSQCEFVYKGPEGLIVIPKTKEAAIFLGRGTKWCTAYTEAYNYFDHYNDQGPLYCFLMQDGRKFQLHFESGQLKDETDRAVSNYEEWGTKYRSIAQHFMNNPEVAKAVKRVESNDEILPLVLQFMSDEQIADVIVKDMALIEKLSKFGINANRVIQKMTLAQVERLVDRASHYSSIYKALVDYKFPHIDKIGKSVPEDNMVNRIGSDSSNNSRLYGILRFYKDSVTPRVVQRVFKGEIENWNFISVAKIMQKVGIELTKDSFAATPQEKLRLAIEFTGTSNIDENRPVLTLMIHALDSEQLGKLLEKPYWLDVVFHAGIKIPKAVLEGIKEKLIYASKNLKAVLVPKKKNGVFPPTGSGFSTDEWKCATATFDDGIFTLALGEDIKAWAALSLARVEAFDHHYGTKIKETLKANFIKSIEAVLKPHKGQNVFVTLDSDMRYAFNAFKITARDLPTFGHIISAAYHRMNNLWTGKHGYELMQAHKIDVHDIGQVTAKIVTQMTLGAGHD